MGDKLGGKVAGFTILGLLLLVAVAWTVLLLWAGDRTPRNAAVEGVDISGLSPAQAESRLRSALAERAATPITVSYGDGRSRDVAPAKAGLSVDHDASVEAASGGSRLDPRRAWALITGGGDQHAELSVDQPRMQATLDDLGRGIETRPVEGAVVFRDGKAVAVKGRPGTVVARGPAQELLERRFLHSGSQKVPTENREPEISDAAVQRAMKEFAEPAMSGPVTLVLAGQRVVAPPRLFGKGLSM
ncbi:MAG: hypothetical protein ABWY19_09605, partial [Marmoricola sp.]